MIKIAVPTGSALVVRSGERNDRVTEDIGTFFFSEVLDQVLPEGSENFANDEFLDETDSTTGIERQKSREPVVEQQVFTASIQPLPTLFAPIPGSVTLNHLASDRPKPSEAFMSLSDQRADPEVSPQTLGYQAVLSVPSGDHSTNVAFRGNRSERPINHLAVNHLSVNEDDQTTYTRSTLLSAVSDEPSNSHSQLSPPEVHDAGAMHVADPPPAGIRASIDAPVAKQLLSLLEAPLKTLPQAMVTDLRKDVPDGAALKVLRMTLKPESLGEVEITIRRSVDEIRVHIQLSRQAAADELRGDLDQLNSRLGGLLPREMSPQITISVREPEVGLGQPQNQVFTRLNDEGAQAGGQGGILPGNGERSSPHKDEPRSRVPKSDGHDSDTPLQLGTSGIII